MFAFDAVKGVVDGKNCWPGERVRSCIGTYTELSLEAAPQRAWWLRLFARCIKAVVLSPARTIPRLVRLALRANACYEVSYKSFDIDISFLRPLKG
jgi:hypothetical protein